MTLASRQETKDFKKGLHSKPSYVENAQQPFDGASSQMNTNTKGIAKQRVHTLFNLAFTNFDQDPNQAQQYVDSARKIAMAAKIKLPRQYRHRVCRHCKKLILPGINCRIRTRHLREPHIVTTCLSCGKQTRIPLKKKQQQERHSL
jgi:ribonuclease P protein subunit RPR2